MRNNQKKCVVDGCKTNRNCKDYCSWHAKALMEHGDLFYFAKLKAHREYLMNHSASSIYTSMLNRVSPNNPNYVKNYYNRGITVCDRWKPENDGRSNFTKDMGERPTLKHSLDRIDNDKGYSPENCRWATASEQCNNTRVNRYITFNSKTQTISQWSKELNILPETIAWRLKAGHSIEDCFKSSLKSKKHYYLDDIIFETQISFSLYVHEKYGIYSPTVLSRLKKGATEYECTLKSSEYKTYRRKKINP